MLEDIYKRNPEKIAKMLIGLGVLSAALFTGGMASKKPKTSKTLFLLSLMAGTAGTIVFSKNQPIGIFSKNPQELITWLKLEGYTNLPEDEIRKTGYYYF